MAGLIPINRVFIQYNPTTAARISYQYYGCLLGVAKELHDLTSKGFFIPDDEDTNLNLNLPGYIRAENEITVPDAQMDTGSYVGYVKTGTYSITFTNAIGSSKTYTVTVSSQGTYTPQDLLLELEALVNAEVNASATALFADDTLTITANNYAYNSYLSALTTALLDKDYITPASYEITPSSYPNIKSGSIVDPYKVKIWSKNSRLFANRTFAGSGHDTSYRIIPVSENAAVIGKRDTSKYTSSQTADIEDDGTYYAFTESWDLSNEKMIEPGSIYLRIYNGADELILTDVPVLPTGRPKVNVPMTGSLYVAYISGNLNALKTAPATAYAVGEELASSYIDYAAGVVHLEESLALTGGTGTVTLTFTLSSMPLTQIKTSSAGFNALKDLKANDAFAMGSFVTTENMVRKITSAWQSTGTSVTFSDDGGGKILGTVVGAAPDNDTRIVVTGSVMPGSVVETVIYYTVAKSGSTFKLSTTPNAAPTLVSYSTAGTDTTFFSIAANTLTRVNLYTGYKFALVSTVGDSSTYIPYRINYDVAGEKMVTTYDQEAGTWDTAGFSLAAAGATPLNLVISVPSGEIERLSISYRTDNITLGVNTDYQYEDTDAKSEMENKQNANDFCDGDTLVGIYSTYARVTAVGSAPMNNNTETISSVVYFSSDIFSKDNAVNYQPVGEFAIIYNEAGYSRCLLDMETVASYPTVSDPIYVEYGGSEATQGNITFLASGNEYTIAATTMARSYTNSFIPGIYTTNFISGDIYVEYEAEIRLSTILNRLNEIDIDAMDWDTPGSIYDSIGKPDPRNWLGFATYLTNKISPNSKFYVMPVTSASTGFQSGLRILSNYRDIKHVAIVNDDFVAALDTWIGSGTNAEGTGENDPNQSRFRLGYCPVAVVNEWYKFGSESAYESLVGGVFHIPAASANYYFTTTDPDVDFTSSARGVAAGDVFTCAERLDVNSNPIEYTVKTVYAQTLIFDQTNSTSETPGVVTVPEIKVYRDLIPSEQAERMRILQTSTNPYVAKVLCGTGIEYTYDNVSTDEEEFTTLGIQFGVVFPFALKIAAPPHQPLTFLEFSDYGFGDIVNMGNYYDMSDFNKLVSAGYLSMTNDIGTAPFCLRDVTCGISLRAAEIEGVLSKVDPVITYAKDIWYTTRPFIGKYNVTDEVVSSIQLKLKAMREYYVAQNYRFLGTLLKTASEPVITKVANGLRIDYTVQPQDALVEINNYVTVVGN